MSSSFTPNRARRAISAPRPEHLEETYAAVDNNDSKHGEDFQTGEESVPSPLRIYGDHQGQSFGIGVAQSSYAPEPGFAEQASEEYDESSDVTEERGGESAFVEETNVPEHSISTAGHDTTASLAPFMASTDADDGAAYDENELRALIESVERDVRQGGPRRVMQDGFRTRYSMHGPSLASHGTPQVERGEYVKIQPEPLKLRSNTHESEEEREKTMTALEFLKIDQEEAMRDEEEYAAAIEASQATASKAQRKASGSSRLATLKRMASANLAKVSKGSKQDTDDPGVPLTVFKNFSRKTSSKTLGDYELESYTPPEPLVSSPPGSELRESIMNPINELEFTSVPYNLGYTLKHTSEPTITPPPKSAKRKPGLSLNTETPKYGKDDQLVGSPGVNTGLKSASSMGSDMYFPDAGESRVLEASDTASESSKTPSGKGKGKRSSSKERAGGLFSPATGKKKVERFTNDHPVVKMIERAELMANFGFTSTKQLYAEDEKKPSRLRSLFSKHSSAATDATPIPNTSATTSTTPVSTTPVASPIQVKHNTPRAHMSYDTTPVFTPHGSLSSVASGGRGRGNSIGSNVRSGSMHSFGQPTISQSDTVSPISSGAIDSSHIRRKAVGSGNLMSESFSEADVNPSQPHYGTSSEEVSESPPQLHYKGSLYVRVPASEQSSIEAPPTPNRGKFDGSGYNSPVHDSRTSSFNEGFVKPGFVVREGSGATNTPFSSKTSSFNETVSSPVSVSHEGSSTTEVLCNPNASGPISGITSPNTGTPSNRLTLEEEAVQKLADKKLEKEDVVAYNINKLRKATGTELVPYHKDDIRVCHKEHRYTFYQKNLICAKCQGNCAVCNAPCCAFKGALQTAMGKKGTEEGAAAAELARTISKWVSSGRDVSTFYRCTECKKSVCPECIGICPIYPCFDEICAKCNPGRLWEPCEYHTAKDWETHHAILNDPKLLAQLQGNLDLDWITK